MSVFVNCLYVALGGMAGSVSRYLLGLVPVKGTAGFPLVTFFINVLGAFFIGLIAAAAQKNCQFSPHMVLLLKAGFCGGFTTFSTFSLESVTLVQNGYVITAVLYIVLSVLLGTAAVFCGEYLIR